MGGLWSSQPAPEPPQRTADNDVVRAARLNHFQSLVQQGVAPKSTYSSVRNLILQAPASALVSNPTISHTEPAVPVRVSESDNNSPERWLHFDQPRKKSLEGYEDHVQDSDNEDSLADILATSSAYDSESSVEELEVEFEQEEQQPQNQRSGILQTFILSKDFGMIPSVEDTEEFQSEIIPVTNISQLRDIFKNVCDLLQFPWSHNTQTLLYKLEFMKSQQNFAFDEKVSTCLGRTLFDCHEKIQSYFTCQAPKKIEIMGGLSIERCAMTIAHELMHVYLHEQKHLARMGGSLNLSRMEEEGLCELAGYLCGLHYSKQQPQHNKETLKMLTSAAEFKDWSHDHIDIIWNKREEVLKTYSRGFAVTLQCMQGQQLTLLQLVDQLQIGSITMLYRTSKQNPGQLSDNNNA